VSINKSKTTTGFAVQLKFQITQHLRDILLMESLVQYLDCGRVQQDPRGPAVVNFVVTKFSDISEKIIPFYEINPLHGAKLLNYEGFRKISELMQTKAHLTASGLDEIRQIKAGIVN
jgi:hypothetical protein